MYFYFITSNYCPHNGLWKVDVTLFKTLTLLITCNWADVKFRAKYVENLEYLFHPMIRESSLFASLKSSRNDLLYKIYILWLEFAYMFSDLEIVVILKYFSLIVSSKVFLFILNLSSLRPHWILKCLWRHGLYSPVLSHLLN